MYTSEHINKTLEEIRYCGPNDELFDIWRAEGQLCSMYLGVGDLEKASAMLDVVVKTAENSIDDWKELCETTGDDPDSYIPKNMIYNFWGR